MLLYNETIGIDKDVEQEWLHWMKEEHMPNVLKTRMFISAKIYKILHNQDDDASTSYSVQYFTEDINNVTLYLEKFAPALVQAHQSKFKGKHVAFRTLLEEV